MIARIKAVLAVAGAVLAAILVAFSRGRYSGIKSATTKAKEADHARADDIRARADAARAAASDDPIAELRRSGRIRD